MNLKIVLFMAMGQLASLSCSSKPMIPISSFEELKASYTGQVSYNQEEHLVTFKTSGIIRFPHRKEFTDLFWGVPKDVRRIVIRENVTVVGHFYTFDDITIEGKDRKTSKVYGTPISGLLRQHNLDRKPGGQFYSAFYGTGDFEMTIRNLTSLNPMSFHFTGKEGCVIHVEDVDAIDDRGGSHNHSDGISAADGSTVKNCFFSSGDDIIKVYHDIYVENTTIAMIRNTVPIQFGWGSYGSGAKGVFKNLTIKGAKGRGGTGNAIIDARRGTYDKTLQFDGLVIDAPNSVLVNFWNENQDGTIGGGNASIRIINADIQIKTFSKRWNMNADIEICGKKYDKSSIQNSIVCD